MPSNRLYILLALCVVSLVASSSRAGTSARFIPVRVLVDGDVVFTGSTSDDGGPDADAVWAYLTGCKLTPTAELNALAKERHAPGASEWTLYGQPDPKGALGANGQILRTADVTLEISYGGTAHARELQLVATPSGDGWCVARAEVERHFDSRLISRREAAELERPKRSKL